MFSRTNSTVRQRCCVAETNVVGLILPADVKLRSFFHGTHKWGKQNNTTRASILGSNNNSNREKKDSALSENTKVDVPQKQAGGVESGHGELRADHFLGYWKRKRASEREVRREGWNDLFFSSGLFALQEIVIWRRLRGLSGWSHGLPGPSRCTVTSHYHCFGECETKEITPKGNAAETSNLLNKWKYVTHTNNSLTLSD